MSVEFLIKMMVAILGEYLLVPAKAAKYAKWLIRARDYLNLLFPTSKYPENWDGVKLDIGKVDYAVPESAIIKASKDRGFNIPFIKGM